MVGSKVVAGARPGVAIFPHARAPGNRNRVAADARCLLSNKEDPISNRPRLRGVCPGLRWR